MTLRAALVLVGVATILVAMVLGPLASPPEFDWLRHSTSEQAGQHMPGAWIMRAGFVAYGGAVLLAALLGGPRPWVRAALALFGLGLIGTAVWSNAPIIGGVESDLQEDWMHSVASGVVGTAFAAACAARIFAPCGDRRDGLAWAGLLIAVAVPVAMGLLPDVRGLLQRGMFVFSFVFVLREARG